MNDQETYIALRRAEKRARRGFMKRARWEYLKNLKPSEGKLVFLSKPLVAVEREVVLLNNETGALERHIVTEMQVTRFKGKTYVKPKTLEDMLLKGLSKRQARKERRRFNAVRNLTKLSEELGLYD